MQRPVLRRAKSVPALMVTALLIAGSINGVVTATADQPSKPELFPQEEVRPNPIEEPSDEQREVEPEGRQCTYSDDKKSRSCVTLPGRTERNGSSVDVKDIIEVPEWCIDADTGTITGTRTKACRFSNALFQTGREVNGNWVITGEASLTLYDYAYTSPTLPYWAHQAGVAPYAGWGDALLGFVWGSATCQGQCIETSVDGIGGELAQLQTWSEGEAQFESLAVNPGDVDHPKTTWLLTFTAPGYPDFPYASESIDDVRCDNNTRGTSDPGCVVEWGQPHLSFSDAAHPDIARHISLAQQAGFPGGSNERPLTRHTDDTLRDAKRANACGDAPSIENKQCDEYPFASAIEGQGDRRTFNGCSLPELPRETYPDGVSACMVDEQENRSQGGVLSQFYSNNRMLDDDQFVVTADYNPPYEFSGRFFDDGEAGLSACFDAGNSGVANGHWSEFDCAHDEFGYTLYILGATFEFTGNVYSPDLCFFEGSDGIDTGEWVAFQCRANGSSRALWVVYV